MRRRIRATKLLGIIMLALTAAACSPSLRTSPLAFGDNIGVYTNGNLRLVTERSRLQPSSGRVLPTVCTEPSPDYAIAFDQSGDLVANLAKLGNGELNVSSKEKTTPLDGRNAGVLALRDGLYAACQSYVSGVIGHDAYALILSQYSELIIELVHERDKAAASATPAVPKDGVADAVTVAPAALQHAALATGPSATGGAILMLTKATPANPKADQAPAVADTAPAAAKAEAERSRYAAYSALLVACISEHDPTRIGGEGGQPKNEMLSLSYCKTFLTQALKATGPGLSLR